MFKKILVRHVLLCPVYSSHEIIRLVRGLAVFQDPLVVVVDDVCLVPAYRVVLRYLDVAVKITADQDGSITREEFQSLIHPWTPNEFQHQLALGLQALKGGPAVVDVLKILKYDADVDTALARTNDRPTVQNGRFIYFDKRSEVV